MELEQKIGRSVASGSNFKVLGQTKLKDKEIFEYAWITFTINKAALAAMEPGSAKL